MKEDVKTMVKSVLTDYLEANNCRQTPERYAILDAVYSVGGYFTMEELTTELSKRKFKVSRGTLYNAMRLFLELRLVIRHRFQSGTKYEACYASKNHSLLICTVCGKIIEVDIPQVAGLIAGTKMRKFKKERYSLYVYGICFSCQHRLGYSKNANVNNKNK